MTARTPAETAEDLAARCEAASGPDRELDALAFRTFGAPVPFQFANKIVALVFDESEQCWFSPIGDMRIRYTPPAYTASIDAALSLVPEGCWAEGSLSSPAALEIHDPMTFDPLGQGWAATPALALTSAALRAHAARLRENGNG